MRETQTLQIDKRQGRLRTYVQFSLMLCWGYLGADRTTNTHQDLFLLFCFWIIPKFRAFLWFCIEELFLEGKGKHM